MSDEDLYFILSLERTREREPWFWRPNHWGYTAHIEGAGKYTKEAAWEIFKASDGMDIPIPVSVYGSKPTVEVLGIEPDSPPSP